MTGGDLFVAYASVGVTGESKVSMYVKETLYESKIKHYLSVFTLNNRIF